MFDDSGFGGSSMFDSNHDGHLNAFERDHAECFMHDCDTYDQVMKKEGYHSYSSSHRGGKSWSQTWEELKILLFFVVVLTVILTLMGL
ncbi:hypothetical protein CIY_14110 [Butyrivibrio fibrisolvens 16/4]|nr:hypothetical protein CIY_14110 [Butyrivibrio fibrisolvens 16/4]